MSNVHLSRPHRARLFDASWYSYACIVFIFLFTALAFVFFDEKFLVSVSEPGEAWFGLLPLAPSLHLVSLEYAIFPAWFVGTESGHSWSSVILALLLFVGFSAWSNTLLQACVLTVSTLVISLVFLGDSLSLRCLLSGSALLLFSCRCPWVRSSSPLYHAFVLLITTLGLVCLSGPWSVSIALYCAVLLFLFAPRMDEADNMEKLAESHIEQEAPLLAAQHMLWIAILASIFLLFFPTPDFPNYPGHAQILPRPAALVSSLFLDSWGIPILDGRSALALLYAPSLCLGGSLLLTLLFPMEKPGSLRAIGFALFLICTLVVQFFLDPGLRLMFPAETLGRMIPGVGLLYFPWGLFFFAVLASMIAFSQEKKIWPPLALALCTILPVACLTSSSLTLREDFGSFGVPEKSRPAFFRAREQEVPESLRHAVFSPSWPLFRDNPSLVLGGPDARDPNTEARRFAKLLSAAHLRHEELPVKRKFLFDGNKDTRLQLRSGEKPGGLHIRFHSPQIIQGLILDPGTFRADTPGGLEILVLEECPELSPLPLERALLLEQAKSIYQQNPWRGPVEWTRDAHPYFAWTGRVQVLFPEEQRAQCLFIHEKQRRTQDWSIAEARLLVPQKKRVGTAQVSP